MSEIKQALKAVWSPFQGSLNSIGSAYSERCQLVEKIQRMRAEIRDNDEKEEAVNTLKSGTRINFLGQRIQGDLSESEWESFKNLRHELSKASATIREHKTNLLQAEEEIQRQNSLLIVGIAKLVSLVTAVQFTLHAVSLCVKAESLPAIVAGISLLIPALICHDCYFVAKKWEDLLSGRAIVQQLANEGKYLFKNVSSAVLGTESATKADRVADITEYVTADTVLLQFFKPFFKNKRTQTAD